MKGLAIFVSEQGNDTVIVSHNEVLFIDEDGETTMLRDDVYPDGEIKLLRTNWLKAAAAQSVFSSIWKRML